MANQDEPLDAWSCCLVWGVAGYALGMCVSVAAAAYAKYGHLDPLITLLLPVPFGAGGLAAGALRWRFRTAASVSAILTAASLTALYLRGFIQIARLMLERKWTAASLSLGFLPLMGLLAAGLVAATVGLATVAFCVARGRRA